MKPVIIRRVLAALFVVTAFGVGCRDGMPNSPGPNQDGTFSVVAQFELNTATNLVIEVSAPDIPQTLIFNLAIVNGTATGSVTVPAGANRLIVVRAFDGRTETHRGSRTVTVVAGVNAPLSLSLLSLGGSLPITVSFGVASVTLTSADSILRAGGTVALTAVVRDESGAVVSAPVLFAVSRPPLARVRADGILTALDTGSVTVTATALGRSASTALTLTAGTVLDGLVLLPDSVIGSGSVNAVVRIRDNVGVDSVRVHTVSPTGTVGPSCASLAPQTGSRTLGAFACPLVVPSGAATGRWPVSSVEVHAGANVAVLDSIALRHRGAAAAVRVVP